jgi:two-component system sensor histidine kinase KdpD
MMTDPNKNAEIRSPGPRGKLKVFLGAVAGVGKTYRMLSEAHRRLARGQDIVVGLVEPHGRPTTAALLEGLEQVPLERIEYRGAVFYELDTDAVLRRKPEWVVIDEMAHTNVPGTRHAKRWQSVQEILDAGINVATTLNIQHLESLNDIVHEITGVRVRETIPDSIVDNADEVLLVDLTPEALINRLKRGDIYHGERIPQALANFFKKGNIVALRELALRKTAEEVDEQLHEYAESHRTRQARSPHEHVVVCIVPRQESARLVRRGYRLAGRWQATFSSLYVQVPGAHLTTKERTALDQVHELVRNLGGTVVEVEGESVAEEIVRYANSVGATHLVMGQSARTRMDEILHGSIINRIMRETQDIDIVVVANPDRSGTRSRDSI